LPFPLFAFAPAFAGAMLRENCALVELRLADNDLTDAGFALLCQALRANRTLRELSCKQNLISWAGVADIGQVHSILDIQLYTVQNNESASESQQCEQ
jgi:Ran GTPase-activating protein (RanGAP) involved in mRNA processing and transport